jgi:hypothetical protein
MKKAMTVVERETIMTLGKNTITTIAEAIAVVK